MENLIFSLNATIPIFLVMVIGYILKNMKFLDEPFVKTLNSFNFKITLPVLLFRDIAASDFLEVWDWKYDLPVAVEMALAARKGTFISRLMRSYTGWPVSMSWLPTTTASYPIYSAILE